MFKGPFLSLSARLWALMGILCTAAAKSLTLFFCLFRENGQLKTEPSTTLPDQESTGDAGTCTSAAPTMWLGAQNGWCVPLGLADLCHLPAPGSVFHVHTHFVHCLFLEVFIPDFIAHLTIVSGI